MLKKYYEQFDCVGALPLRNYYVPFSSNPKGKKREESERFTSLNGEWKMRAYESVLDVSDEFYLSSPSDVVPVPSCVQTLGYDANQYTNVNYPFPYDPPYTPPMNPAFHYQRTIEVAKDGEKKYLVFEGVDSCFYLYVNNRFVGFAQISHKVSEFDVTDYLTDGANKLDVLVLKWCAGSYFEDQDKWRFTGIFRDVYMLSRPVNHVVDYHITASMKGELTFEYRKGAPALVTFGKAVKRVEEGETVVFVKKDPRLWSAETPNLYDLTVECNGEIILERVGFCTVEVKNKQMLFNGKGIKLLGVNRHDFHPKTGATVTYEDMYADLVLMKKLNINALRTSHYPSCPELYKMCDELGLYVVSESDLETHGAAMQEPGGDYEVTYGDLARRGFVQQAWTRRQEANIWTNFNHPSIIMWSAGNESGYGEMADRVLRYMRSLDPTRLMHYERINNVMHLNRELYHTDAVDMANRMYPAYEHIDRDYFNDPDEFRPYFLCEYAHAMGNGPGDVYDYIDYFFAHDCMMGGCVWEWADHGLDIGEGHSYRYGGDFGETLHDSNFCIDGMVTADRQCKPGTYEIKKAYQPLIFAKEANQLIIESRLFFLTLTGMLEIVYKDKGEVKGKEKINLAIAPRDTVKLPITDAQTVIVTFYRGREDVAFACFNEPVSFDSPVSGNVTIEQKGRYYQVNAGATTFTLDRASGEIVSIEKEGKSFGGMPLTIFRAPTDNDRNVKRKWNEYRLFYAHSDAKSVTVEGNKIIVTAKMQSEIIIPILSYTMTYTFGENAVNAHVDYEINPRFEQIPRIGFALKESKSYKDIEVYGYKAGSYMDIHHFSPKDMMQEKVKDSYFPYVKPQESGSHFDCDYASVSGKEGAITVTGEGFSFAAVPYSDAELAAKAHHDELVSDGTHIHLDFFMQGMGSNSCGPELYEYSRIPLKASKAMTIRFE